MQLHSTSGGRLCAEVRMSWSPASLPGLALLSQIDWCCTPAMQFLQLQDSQQLPAQLGWAQTGHVAALQLVVQSAAAAAEVLHLPARLGCVVAFAAGVAPPPLQDDHYAGLVIEAGKTA